MLARARQAGDGRITRSGGEVGHAGTAMPGAVLVPVVAVSRYGRAGDVGLPAGRIGQGGSAARWMGAVLSVRGRASRGGRCGPRNRREPGGPIGVCLAGGAVLVLPVPCRAGLPVLGPGACCAGPMIELMSTNKLSTKKIGASTDGPTTKTK